MFAHMRVQVLTLPHNHSATLTHIYQSIETEPALSRKTQYFNIRSSAANGETSTAPEPCKPAAHLKNAISAAAKREKQHRRRPAILLRGQRPRHLVNVRVAVLGIDFYQIIRRHLTDFTVDAHALPLLVGQALIHRHPACVQASQQVE